MHVDLAFRGFQQTSNACRRQALAQRRHNSARHKDVLRRHIDLVFKMYCENL